MDKKIQEFIANYIPKRITKETRYKLQAELENHIYERIDFYTEIGYSEEESLEKALKDFGDDKETKEQIKKNLENIHIPWSLADFFAKSIPITVAIILIGGTLLHIFLFEFVNIKNIIIIPLIIWLMIIALKSSKRIHHTIKSIIAVILVVPHFIFILIGNFLWTPTYQLKPFKEDVIKFYSECCEIDELSDYLPAPSEIGEPIDAIFFSIGEDTIFGNDQRSTWVFKYSPSEYRELKNKFNENIEYMKTYSNHGYFIDDEYQDEDITYKCDFAVYGFDFRTIEKIYDPDEFYDSWYLIGTNDETHEIVFVESIELTPTFDETFIKEDCGWRYFYFLTKF